MAQGVMTALHSGRMARSALCLFSAQFHLQKHVPQWLKHMPSEKWMK